MKLGHPTAEWRAMEYLNRHGTAYFIFQGVTKTGKPKYFASKKATSDSGTRIESLPDEFEILRIRPMRWSLCAGVALRRLLNQNIGSLRKQRNLLATLTRL